MSEPVDHVEAYHQALDLEGAPRSKLEDAINAALLKRALEVEAIAKKLFANPFTAKRGGIKF